MNSVKKRILNHLEKEIDNKILNSKTDIHRAIESRNESTKSSAGDKHETSRALIQLEIEKYNNQLNKALFQKNEITKIHELKTHNYIGPGSLVNTSNGVYLISIGIGKITIEKDVFFCISLASPIGRLLRGKKAEEIVNFNNQQIKILQIL
jgi:hypothetical protein